MQNSAHLPTVKDKYGAWRIATLLHHPHNTAFLDIAGVVQQSSNPPGTVLDLHGRQMSQLLHAVAVELEVDVCRSPSRSLLLTPNPHRHTLFCNTLPPHPPPPSPPPPPLFLFLAYAMARAHSSLQAVYHPPYHNHLCAFSPSSPSSQGIPPALTPQAIFPPASILLLDYAMARARSSLQHSWCGISPVTYLLTASSSWPHSPPLFPPPVPRHTPRPDPPGHLPPSGHSTSRLRYGSRPFLPAAIPHYHTLSPPPPLPMAAARARCLLPTSHGCGSSLAASCPPPMAAALQLKPHPDSLLLPPSKGPPWPYLCLAYPSALATEANTYFILTAFFTILTHMHPSAVSLGFLLLLVTWVWLFLWPSSSRTSSQASHQTSSHAERSSSALHSSSRTSAFRTSAPALRAYMAPLTASFAATVLLLRYCSLYPELRSILTAHFGIDLSVLERLGLFAPLGTPVHVATADCATLLICLRAYFCFEAFPKLQQQGQQQQQQQQQQQELDSQAFPASFFGWVSFFKRLIILHCPTALPCAAFFAALYPVSALGFGFLLLAVLGCVGLRAVRGTAPRWMFLYGGAALVAEFGFQVVVAQWGLAGWVEQHSAMLQVRGRDCRVQGIRDKRGGAGGGVWVPGGGGAVGADGLGGTAQRNSAGAC
ncbi:unnamed protein product [Closterium sp. Yama58-4]|nr:unnamed protein product [Closterium sp. Yama58-4]